VGKTTKLAVNGAAGRMGRQLLAAIAERDDTRLVGATDAPGQACIGVDASVLSGGADTGVSVVDDLQLLSKTTEVVIDFTAPKVSLAVLQAAKEAKNSVVIGTTGFTPGELEQLRSYADSVPIMFAANYSVGVTITLDLIAKAATALGDDYDVEIIEAHHRHKVDAPSGTAVKMGEHTVLYAGNGERIELTHKTTDRMTFARGAVRAAIWVSGQPPGLYDMRDVLGLA